MKIKIIFLFISSLTFLFIGCIKTHTNSENSLTTSFINDTTETENLKENSKSVNEYQTFYSYEQAVYFYNTHFIKDEFYPKSSSIYKTVYFTNSKRKVFLVYFKNKPTKGYIHEGMEYENRKTFCNSSSPGNFYNVFIKGKKGKGSSPYNFKLSVN
jgi:hypothetical protein